MLGRDGWEWRKEREGYVRAVPLGPQRRIPQADCAPQSSPQGKVAVFLLLSLSCNVCAVPRFKCGNSYFLNHSVS